MRELIRRGEYSLTDHAEEELDADELSTFDLERIALAGFIADRQRDVTTGEWKYVLEGPTTGGRWAIAVAKISASDRLVFLTVFRL
jgi:hypothetical protein